MTGPAPKVGERWLVEESGETRVLLVRAVHSNGSVGALSGSLMDGDTVVHATVKTFASLIARLPELRE